MTDSPNVFLYLRKSRDKTEQADPDLLHKHRREGLRWAAERRLIVNPGHIFEEIGSGERLAARPACQHLLATIERLPRAAGGYLWTTEVSRLTRGSLSDRAIVYERLSRPHVRHCTREGDFDLLNPHQLRSWEERASSASYELGVFRERVAAARIDMVLEGRILTGHPPFGWRWNPGARDENEKISPRVETHPQQFPVVQALCRDALLLSTYKLAARYGLPQPVVANLLRNPFICGLPAKRHFPHNGERTRRDNGQVWKTSSARVPRDQWIRPEQSADYEPACTPEEFERIQAVLDARRFHRCKTGGEDGWCREVVRFVGYEGHARLSAKGDGPRRFLTYELTGRPRGEHKIYIRRAAVHEAAFAAVARLFAAPDRVRRQIERYQADRAEGAVPLQATAGLADEIQKLERRLVSLLGREDEAVEARDLKEIASIRAYRAEIKQKLASLEQQVAALAASVPADAAIDLIVGDAALLEMLTPSAIETTWEGLDGSDRQRVVNGFIEAICCHIQEAPRGFPWRREVEEVRLRGPFRA